MKNNLIEEDIHAFFKMAPETREKRISALSLEEQLSLTLFAPWEKRHEIITASPRARELVQAMPAEELFWTVKAVGPEDSTVILRLASPSQLQLFFDLDWWHKAEIRPEKIAAWLLVMSECSQDAVDTWLRWILQKDIWLVASIFNTFIEVIKRPDDMDIQEAKDLLPPFTLDNVYYISFKRQKLAPLFASIIGKILAISPGWYRDLFETMLWQTPSHNLETAYRLRCGRLLDHGIPDYYESLDIYLPMKPEQMHRMETSHFRRLPIDHQMPPFVPTLYVSGFPVLEAGVRHLAGSRVMERIVREITGVANKIMMADLIDLDDPGALKHALEKTFSLLNLGIDYLCGKWSVGPEQVLDSCFLEEIVRVAADLLLPISTQAFDIRQRHSSRFLPYETRDQLDAACHRPAMLYDESSSTEVFISSMGQVETAGRYIEKARQWSAIVEGLRPKYTAWDNIIDWQKTNFVAPEEFTAEAAFCTSACNFLLNGKLLVRPIRPDQLPVLKKRIEHTDATEVAEKILKTLPLDNQSNDNRVDMNTLVAILCPILETCFKEIKNANAKGPESLPFLKTILVEAV